MGSSNLTQYFVDCCAPTFTVLRYGSVGARQSPRTAFKFENRTLGNDSIPDGIFKFGAGFSCIVFLEKKFLSIGCRC